VTERERDCLVTTIGALAGAIASYLLFTERGRQMRRQIVPALEELEQELSSFRGSLVKTAGLASEGWRLLNEAIGETSPPPRASNPHQTAPF
jgi:hypothetical protein